MDAEVGHRSISAWCETLTAFQKGRSFDWKEREAKGGRVGDSLKGKPPAAGTQQGAGRRALCRTGCRHGFCRSLYKTPSAAPCKSLPIFALQMPQNWRSVSCVVTCITHSKSSKVALIASSLLARKLQETEWFKPTRACCSGLRGIAGGLAKLVCTYPLLIVDQFHSVVLRQLFLVIRHCLCIRSALSTPTRQLR